MPSELLAVDGVAGAYRYRTTDLAGIGPAQGERYGMPVWDPGDRTLTVVFCDDDPVATTARAEPVVRRRWEDGSVVPELAAPLRSTVTHAGDDALSPTRDSSRRTIMSTRSMARPSTMNR